MADSEYDQFGKFFGVLGAIAGFCYGAVVTDGNGIAALVLAVIGGVSGVVVGKIVYRVILIALIIVGFLIRQQIFNAIGNMFE